MPRKKKDKVCCPAPDCRGGYSHRLYEVNAKLIQKIPPEVLARKKDDESIYRCNYCGFVWGQKSYRRMGIDVTPLGFYDNFTNPNKFVAVSENYETRRS